MAQETIFSIFQIMKLLMKIKIGLYYVGYQNGTILAILNLHVSLMPPIKFQLNPT